MLKSWSSTDGSRCNQQRIKNTCLNRKEKLQCPKSDCIMVNNYSCYIFIRFQQVFSKLGKWGDRFQKKNHLYRETSVSSVSFTQKTDRSNWKKYSHHLQIKSKHKIAFSMFFIKLRPCFYTEEVWSKIPVVKTSCKFKHVIGRKISHWMACELILMQEYRTRHDLTKLKLIRKFIKWVL